MLLSRHIAPLLHVCTAHSTLCYISGAQWTHLHSPKHTLHAYTCQVRSEVWGALLQRFTYEQVTDLLRVMRAARVIERAVKRMRRKRWARDFARIDVEAIAKVHIHVHIMVDTT